MDIDEDQRPAAAPESRTVPAATRARSPWWLATTSPVIAVILTVLWGGMFLWSAINGGGWDAFRIVQVCVTGLLTVAYAVAAAHLNRPG